MPSGQQPRGDGLFLVEGVAGVANIVMALVGPDDQPGQRYERRTAEIRQPVVDLRRRRRVDGPFHQPVALQQGKAALGRISLS